MPHSTDNQHIFYIDPSAVSGSTNHLRDELGLTWISGEEAISSVSASTQLIMSYEDMSQWTSLNTPVLELSAPTWLGQITSISQGLRYVELQPIYQTTGSVDKITPNYVIPGRFYGAASTSPEGTINNDVEWKAYLLGGTVGTKTYPGIYSETEFSDFGFEYILPYSADEALTLGLNDNPAKITYSYNLSLPEVERRYGDKSELELPLIELLKEGDDGGSANSAVKKFLTLETLYADTDELNSLLSPKEVDYFPLVSVTPLPTNEPKYQDLTKNLVEYLITGSQMELSASTVDTALPKLKNLLYGAASADRLQDQQAGADGSGVLEHYPSFVTITFPTNLNESDEETSLRSVFEAYDNTEGLLRIIKENFGEAGNAGPQQFVTQNSHGDFGIGNQTISSTTLKTRDLIEMLVNDYNAQSTSNDFYVVGGSSNYAGPQNLLSSEVRNGSRFLTSRATLGVLSQLAGFLAGGDTPDGSTIVDLDVELEGMQGKNGIYAILEKGGVSNYHETVAYRIEKRRGASNRLLQNIWIYNSRANETIGAPVKFKDSQVKYAENYKYTIYAYVLVGGMTYKMGDLAIGRTIGTAADTTGTQFGAAGSHCVQFYDPATDATTEQLFSLLATSSAETWTAGNGSDQYHGALNYIGVATAGGSQFATNAQTISPYPYLADFKLYYEPVLKMMEVPIFSQTLGVLDHPAADLDVIPFQKIDNSQTLGFFIKAESFEPSNSFPTTITEADEVYKTAYLGSNKVNDTAPVPFPAQSPHAKLEIFRMDEKPRQVKDFKDHLYKTVSLKIKNTEEYLSTYVFYDKVSTNKKYYYLMRFLSEHGHAGPLSPVIEAEIVNDGGYKYSLFDNLYDQDLDDSSPTSPSMTFKKLMHILPTTSQLFLQTDGVNFSAPATEALEDDLVKVGITDDSIFDQTFKIRLTSKKTGKKIDLNLTFNLDDGS
jgi:hypothetical protein